MRPDGILGALAIGAVLTCGEARAQATQDAAAAATDADEKDWSFYASVFGYLLPDASDYGQPTLTADRDWLHLEARYQYEGLKSGSLWVGYNFSFGDEVALELTPMLGGVFGDTQGIAPGYKASLSWRKLELNTEGEYVFDTGSSSDSFFFTWSELGWSPAEWCRFGFVVQRTKTYETEFDIQRGLLAGLTYKDASFTGYVLNPDADQPTVVLALGVSF